MSLLSPDLVIMRGPNANLNLRVRVHYAHPGVNVAQLVMSDPAHSAYPEWGPSALVWGVNDVPHPAPEGWAERVKREVARIAAEAEATLYDDDPTMPGGVA